MNSIENVQPLAVCLHASASSNRQWQKLSDSFGPDIRSIAPDLIGYAAGERFRAGTISRMDDEVDHVLAQIAAQTGKRNGPLHLIGHSFGGAVALQLSLRVPERVASLTLYEPAQFLMLFEDEPTSVQVQEIQAVSRAIVGSQYSPIGRWRAARTFIDYWSGRGAWASQPFRRKRRFARLLPKVAAEFESIVTAGCSSDDFAALDVPTRLIYGSRTRATARRVTEILGATIPDASCVEIEGLGHMGPCTNPEPVNEIIREHVLARLSAPARAAA